MKTSTARIISGRRTMLVAIPSLILICAAHLCPPRACAQTGNKPSANLPAVEKSDGPVAQGESNGMKIFALRLKPGQDLRVEVERFAKEKNIRAGFIMTTVGSLEKAALRLADKSEASTFDGKFEIVSLVGTLSPDGVHLHISISDGTGRTIGGHLVEGCRIYTTAEIVIGDAVGMAFTRETDKLTGYKELFIRRAVRPERDSKRGA